MTSPATRRSVATAMLCCTAAITAACTSTAGSSATGQQSPTPAASPRSATAVPASTPPASPAPSPTPAPPSPQSSTSPALTGCASSALKARVVTAQGGAAAGSTYYPIDFTNTSGAACTMFGYPGVSFVTGQGGTRLGRPARRNTAVAPVPVTLPPGGVAHATIQVTDAGNYTHSECKPVTGHWLKIYPPNQFTAIYARLTTQVCSAKLPQTVGSQLGVYVVRPGAGKAGQGP